MPIAILIILRFVFASSVVGYAVDFLGCFHYWAKNIQEQGLAFAYITNYTRVDYPPVYLYVLWMMGAVVNFSSRWWDENFYVLIMKLPALLADLAIAFMAFKITRESCKAETQKRHLPFISAIIMLICPTMLINSAMWGQIDSFLCLFLLLSFYCGIKKKYVPCAILYVMAILTKPQGAIFAPIVLIFFIEALITKKFKEAGIAILSSLGLIFVICYFVSPENGLNIWWIKDKLFSTMNQYPYATMNANNLYYILGWNFIREKHLTSVNWQLIKVVVPCVATLFVWLFWILSKINRTTKTFLAAAILMLTVYCFMPEMHERYSYPAVVFIAFSFFSCIKIRFILSWLLATTASFMNHYWVLMPNMWIGLSYQKMWEFEPIMNRGAQWANMFIVALILTVVLSLTLKEDRLDDKADLNKV